MSEQVQLAHSVPPTGSLCCHSRHIDSHHVPELSHPIPMQEYTKLSSSRLIAWTETHNILPWSSYLRQVWPLEFNFLLLVCEWGVLCFPSLSWSLRLAPDHHVQDVPSSTTAILQDWGGQLVSLSKVYLDADLAEWRLISLSAADC